MSLLSVAPISDGITLQMQPFCKMVLDLTSWNKCLWYRTHACSISVSIDTKYCSIGGKRIPSNWFQCSAQRSWTRATSCPSTQSRDHRRKLWIGATGMCLEGNIPCNWPPGDHTSSGRGEMFNQVCQKKSEYTRIYVTSRRKSRLF